MTAVYFFAEDGTCNVLMGKIANPFERDCETEYYMVKYGYRVTITVGGLLP